MKNIFVLLFLVLAAYGQQEQKRVAILNTEGEGDLIYLSVRLREIAVKVLPKDKYSIMTAESIIDKLGSKENAAKVCREAQCLAKIGQKVSAAYIGQARVGDFDGNLTIFMELYNSASGTLVDSFTGEARDLSGLLKVINEKAPQMFGKLPGVSGGKSQSPSVEGGISGLQKTTSYESDDEKQYVVNLSTEPSGAFMSFDGVPATSCPKTPCKAELSGGNVRIIAALEQYEKADTTVLIKQNKQNISIKLKPSFGVLEIKPAYLDGIGNDKPWDLSINGKLHSLLYSLSEINLSPSKYSVKLSHECYESIDFNAGINKGKREFFDMASNVTLKKGGLALSAERGGEPVSEPVFVNGKRVGETPFSGSVPLCAKIEIGEDKEIVDVKLKYKEKIKHTHPFHVNKFVDAKPSIESHSESSYTENRSETSFAESSDENSFTDVRDGKTYKMVKIGNQTWMAENMNYEVKSFFGIFSTGSKCYDNNTVYCDKYGRLYDWSAAKDACPEGWHLPSNIEWQELVDFARQLAGRKLKSRNGWSNNGNGTDAYGFSALPGGYGGSDGTISGFGYAGNYGAWWSSSELNSFKAYNWFIRYDDDNAKPNPYNSDKNNLLSVRCLQDEAKVEYQADKVTSESDSDLVGLYYNLSFYKPSITSFYEYKNQELKWNGLTLIAGADAIVENNNSFGLFFGLGGFWESSGLMDASIIEVILGADAKKLFWLSKRPAMRIAMPISLGLAWRGQFADIENRLVAEFINEPKFLQESEDYLNGRRNILRHNIDLMPAVDLQVFIGKLSLYVGYMYRATLSSDWGFEYKILGKYYEKDDSGNHYSVPEKYSPLKDSKEQFFGIPGTLRFGIKYKYE
ncbi:MAG: PEGA domain-containing protein [Fibromonadales bacterium]|nr:PEGA domain-containing protein [Fibromonadales bacterium]